jgi:LCP family protein required for cell wall assembly
MERLEKPIKKANNKAWRIIIFVFFGIIVGVFLLMGLVIIKYPSFAKAGYNFLVVPNRQIASDNGNINILVMGKPGGIHEGSELTDTMMFVSVSLSEAKINTISIPRDIWIPELVAKINSAYYWGKTGTPYFNTDVTGGGISFAKNITEKVVGQKIQYGIVVDFSAFKDLVDALGGIEVDIENSFTDNLYPVEGRENDDCNGDDTFACRYETINFNRGTQDMDGVTSLKFVRSRHAEGKEGTDIAREARQQKVIEAIKNKILQPKVYLSVKNISSIFLVVEKYVETDLDIPTTGILARKILDSINNISQKSIPENLLINPPISTIYNNLYVFIPRLGNGRWEEIHQWVSENTN